MNDEVLETESGPIGWVPDGRLLRVVVQDVATGERLLDTTGEARDYSWTRVRGWTGTNVELSIAFAEKEPLTP